MLGAYGLPLISNMLTGSVLLDGLALGSVEGGLETDTSALDAGNQLGVEESSRCHCYLMQKKVGDKASLFASVP